MALKGCHRRGDRGGNCHMTDWLGFKIIFLKYVLIMLVLQH